MKITIQYNNTNYVIEAEDDLCNQILSDPAYAQAFIEQSLVNQSRESVPTATLPTQNSQDSQVSQEVPFVESLWEHRSVLLFLEECSKNKTDLRNPKIRRRTVFLRIKEAMQQRGYLFKESSLEKKLANLKTRYNLILDNNKKTSTGRGRMSWPYFDQMSLIYEEEVSVREAPTVSSLNAASCSSLVCAPSTSRAEQKQRTPTGLRTKLLALEEEKLAVAKEVLQELKELRILKQRKLEFEMMKYSEEKENRAKM